MPSRTLASPAPSKPKHSLGRNKTNPRNLANAPCATVPWDDNGKPIMDEVIQPAMAASKVALKTTQYMPPVSGTGSPDTAVARNNATGCKKIRKDALRYQSKITKQRVVSIKKDSARYQQKRDIRTTFGGPCSVRAQISPRKTPKQSQLPTPARTNLLSHPVKMILLSMILSPLLRLPRRRPTCVVQSEGFSLAGVRPASPARSC